MTHETTTRKATEAEVAAFRELLEALEGREWIGQIGPISREAWELLRQEGFPWGDADWQLHLQRSRSEGARNV